MEQYLILGIDVGINNLGMSLITSDLEFNFISIVGLDLINIREWKCGNGLLLPSERITRQECPLYHKNCVSDWLEHIFTFYNICFLKSDFILIERQPMTGLVCVEQLIFSKFRTKAFLIHPRSMHKYFEIGHQNYEQRKISTVNILKENINIQYVLDTLNSFKRKHDMADSFCIVLFWLSTKRKELNIEKIRQQLEKFKFKN